MRKKDEGFTNIRIREETREELRKLGTYNESMDDIVLKCVDAYKNMSSKEYGKDTRFDHMQKQIEELNKKLGLTYENKERAQKQPSETRKQDYALTEKIPPDFKSDALEVTDDKTNKKAKLK